MPLQPGSCEVIGEQDVARIQKLQSLAIKVCEDQVEHRGQLSPNISLIQRKTGNRSGADVYEVKFLYRKDKTAAMYIFKVYNGPKAKEDALVERAAHKTLQNNRFFAIILDRYSDHDDTVVYTHVEQSSAASAETLTERLTKCAVSALTVDQSMLQSFGKFFTGVHDVFARYQARSIDGADYVDGLQQRLVPDILLLADDFTYKPSERRLTLKLGRSTPDHDETPTVSATELASPETRPADWVCIVVSVTPLARTLRYWLPLAGPGVTIWLRLTTHKGRPLPTDGDSISIYLHPEHLRLPSRELESLGYPASAQLSWAELRRHFAGIQVRMTQRHSDLHTDNVLVAGDAFTAVDLAALNDEIVPVCHARLEASIWYNVIPQLKLDPDAIRNLLDYVSGKNTQAALAATAIGMGDFLRVIRKDLSSRLTRRELTDHEVLLAYVSQALLHQRYALADGVSAPCLSEYLQHWIRKLTATGNTTVPVDHPEQPGFARDLDQLKSTSLRLEKAIESLSGDVGSIKGERTNDIIELTNKISSLQQRLDEFARESREKISLLETTMAAQALDADDTIAKTGHAQSLQETERIAALSESIAELREELGLDFIQDGQAPHPIQPKAWLAAAGVAATIVVALFFMLRLP